MYISCSAMLESISALQSLGMDHNSIIRIVKVCPAVLAQSARDLEGVAFFFKEYCGFLKVSRPVYC